jgi:hypothetical protein
MTRRLATTVLGVVLAVAGAAACGSDGFDREDFIAELQESGIPEAQAVCITDGMVARVDEGALENPDKLDAEQQRILAEVTMDCVGLDPDMILPADGQAPVTEPPS